MQVSSNMTNNEKVIQMKTKQLTLNKTYSNMELAMMLSTFDSLTWESQIRSLQVTFL